VINVNRNPTASDIRKFGWAMLGGFTFLALLAWMAAWRGGAPVARWAGSAGQIAAAILLPIGVFVFVLSRVAVAPSKNLYVAWMTVGFAIGTVVSTILLTVLFVLVLPFFSLIVRAGDPLRRNLRASESHWGDYKPHEPTLDRMRRLF
jgi:hypothetical protein